MTLIHFPPSYTLQSSSLQRHLHSELPGHKTPPPSISILIRPPVLLKFHHRYLPLNSFSIQLSGEGIHQHHLCSAPSSLCIHLIKVCENFRAGRNISLNHPDLGRGVLLVHTGIINEEQHLDGQKGNIRLHFVLPDWSTNLACIPVICITDQPQYPRL
jgi:hypothetical protein